jgi:hypothetical protein
LLWKTSKICRFYAVFKKGTLQNTPKTAFASGSDYLRALFFAETGIADLSLGRSARPIFASGFPERRLPLASTRASSLH